MTNSATMSVLRQPKLDHEQRARLFQHGLHEEGVFYNRLNFFLLFESLLFGATMTVLAATAPLRSMVTLMAIMGIGVCLVWWYAQVNKLVLLKTLEERAKIECPEFAETVEMANERRIFRLWSANCVLAYFFPLLFSGCWIAILIMRR